MKNVYLMLLSMSLLSSCRIDDIDSWTSNAESDVDEYHITVEIEEPVVCGEVKSSFSDAALARITDLNVFVYHEGRLLEDYGGYFEDISSVMLSFPYGKDGFNIYMAGNVGELKAPSDESDMSEMSFVVDDYEDFHEKGVPVAEVFRDFRKGSQALFRLKRLVGRYDIAMKISAEDTKYEIKDVRLQNCALDMYPFSNGRKATEFTGAGAAGGGDILTEDDIARLNAGETVSLYFVENLQGELLPDNTDRRKKIPSSLDELATGIADCCTYIEITADITTPAAEYTDGKYRFYLGQNETTDFSIRRNTLYSVTLDFTQNMVCEEEWRIEIDSPEIKEFVLSKNIVNIVKGAGDYILITGPRVTIDNEASDEADSDRCMYYLTDVVVGGKKCQKLIFYTYKDIEGFYSWGTDYKKSADVYDIVLKTVETYNGTPLMKKNVKAYVYDRVFPLFIRMGNNGSSTPYQIEAVTDAPLNVNLSVKANVNVAINDQQGSTGSYVSSDCMMGLSKDGYRCCSAVFSSLYNNIGSSSEKAFYFKRMDVNIAGIANDSSSAEQLYMGEGGKAYWGPGATMYPQRFSDLSEGGEITMNTEHSCSIPGCIRYTVYSGSIPLFNMSPDTRTCNTIRTTGTSNSLSYDISAYNEGNYLPFYIVNGQLEYSYPVTLLNESAKYLDDSARKSIIYEMYGPGRDVFYPNGVKWGNNTEKSPSHKHRFGYTAGMVKQFWGNIHTWQIFQDYECDFYMTVNGCTAWPGASKLSTGFQLTYNL